ncbi:unnamed protein product, partial [Choristocarpus tenellus]
MDIYADLPSVDKTAATSTGGNNATNTKKPKSGGWAHSKFQGMIAKRTSVASTRMAPPSLLKRPSVPSSGLGRKVTPEKVAPPTPQPPAPRQPSTPNSPRPPSWDMGFGDVEDPYDPAHPNDYIEYCSKRVNRKLEEERNRELKRIAEERERERKRQEEERSAT